MDKPYLFVSQSGCLLPFLIIFNLFFGWIFIKPLLTWLVVEIIMILLFVLKAHIFSRQIRNASSRHRNAVDVEAEVMDTQSKTKRIKDSS